MTVPSFIRKFDFVLLTIAVALVFFGIATFYGIGSRSGEFITRQLIFLGIGIVVMVLVSLFDYRILKNSSAASIGIYLTSIFLLLLALASREIRGVSSWIAFGGFTFEPAEIAKLALLILLAKYFSQKHVEIYRTHHILASGVYALIPAALTFIQPDLGSVVVLVILWMAMLLFAGIKRRHLLIILMTGLVASSMAWFLVLRPYQKIRVQSFLNPYLDPRGSGYNTLQAQTTFGSGQLFGVVFDKKNNSSTVSVPEPYNDFAFATFARKFGFAGVLALLSLLVILMLRIGSIATKTHNNFAKLFSLGFMTIVFTHVFINGGVNLGVLPITGIPFSFLSYGGSHLVTLMIGLGIIQNIRMNDRA